MKNIKVIVSIIVVTILITSCGVKEFEHDQVGICEETLEEKNRLRMEFYAKDDKVGAYKMMIGFKQTEFEGRNEKEIEEIIQSELGLIKSPVDHITVGFEHVEGFTYVAVHFTNLSKTTAEDFVAMGINDRILDGTDLYELVQKDNIQDEGIKCWVIE